MSNLYREFKLATSAREFLWRNGLRKVHQYPMAQTAPGTAKVHTLPFNQPPSILPNNLNQKANNGVPSPDRGITAPWPYPVEFKPEEN